MDISSGLLSCHIRFRREGNKISFRVSFSLLDSIQFYHLDFYGTLVVLRDLFGTKGGRTAPIIIRFWGCINECIASEQIFIEKDLRKLHFQKGICISVACKTKRPGIIQLKIQHIFRCESAYPVGRKNFNNLHK